MDDKKQEIVNKVSQDPELLTEVMNTEAAQTVIVQQAMSIHQGPLPPAKDFAEYDKFIPNFGDRVMTYAENAQKERFALQTKELNQRKLGSIFGFASVILVAFFCFYLVATGNPGLGASVMMSVLIGIAAVFAIGKKIETGKNKPEQKDE